MESPLQQSRPREAFRQYLQRLCRRRFRIFCYLGLASILLLSRVDRLLLSSKAIDPAALPLGAGLALLVLLLVVVPRLPARLTFAGVAAVTVVLATFNLWLIWRTGGYDSPYYAGLNLIVLTVSLIFPLGAGQTAVLCGLVYATYLFPLLAGSESGQPEAFLGHNLFLLATMVIAVVGASYLHGVRYREFTSRHQLARSHQEQSLFFTNLGNLINSDLDWQSAVLSLLRLLKGNFGWQSAAYVRLDQHQRFSDPPLVAPGDETFGGAIREVLSALIQSPDFFQAVLQGKPFPLAARSDGARARGKGIELGHLVALPLSEGSEPSGVLLMDGGPTGRETSPEHLRMLASLSESISAALTKARLFEGEKRRTAQLLVIHKIGRTISAILDFKALYREFAGLVQEHFGYEHLSIYSFDERKRLVLKAQIDSTATDPMPRSLTVSQEHPVGRAQLQGESWLGTNEEGVEGSLLAHTRSQMCVPFSYSAQTLGVVNVESERDRAFTPQDMAVLETLCDYLAICVRNAHLYADVNRKAGALQTLNSIGRAISSELNINNLFDLIYRQVSPVLESEHFYIALNELGSHRIEVKFEVVDGIKRSYQSSFSHDGLATHVIQSQTPLLVKDHFERVYTSIAKRSPHRLAKSWLGVPLILGDQALGVIVLENFRRRYAYDEEHLSFLSTIADQAAVAISNARLFREAEGRATRLAVVNEITREATLSLAVDTIFEKVTTQLLRAISFQKSTIALYLPETDTFSLVNVYGENITAGFYKGMEIPGRDTVMKIAVDTKMPYYTRSLDKAASPVSPYLVMQGIQSAVSIPIISEGICLGTLNLGSQQENAFSDEQIEFLATIANSLGTALKNARLYSALGQSYSALQETQEQLVKSEKLRALGEMSAGVAHDFNNVLGVILGRAQFMKARTDDPNLQRGLEIIEKSAIEGSSTVRRLQDFTRQRTDKAFVRVDLVQIIEDTLSLTRPRWEDSAQASGIQYQIKTRYDSVLPVAGESSELLEVFTAIVFNALEAMPHGGRIHIRVFVGEGRVAVQFRDGGRGMTEEVRQRVFDPFFSTKGVQGNGLGMSVAYGIIRRHRGDIEIESVPDEGTTVTVSLPINVKVTSEEKKVEPGQNKRLGRFLIVDDEAPIRDLLAELLREQGHEVFTAGNGREALEIFRVEAPDLVITDLGMPEVSGLEVATTIKSLRPATAVVMMTGWGATLDADKAQEQGVDVVIAKPFQISEIQKILNGMLESRLAAVE